VSPSAGLRGDARRGWSRNHNRGPYSSARRRSIVCAPWAPRRTGLRELPGEALLCFGSFSGFLLFKELSPAPVHGDRSELGRLFQAMAVMRPPWRFLNRALRFARPLRIESTQKLSTKRPITWFPLSWVLYSVLPVRKDRLLALHPDRPAPSRPIPDNAFCRCSNFLPRPGCQGTRTHGEHLQPADPLLPGLKQGLPRQALLQPFSFLCRCFLTHSLTVCERGNFLRIPGIDPHLFDAEVIAPDQPHRPPRLPGVFDLENSRFLGPARPAGGPAFQEIQAANWAEFPLPSSGA